MALVVILLVIGQASAFVVPPAVVITNPSAHLLSTSSSRAATPDDATTESATATKSNEEDVNSNSDGGLTNFAVLLDDALKYNSKNSSSTLVTNLMNLRQQSDPMAAESYLDEILSIVDSSTNTATLIPRFSTRLSQTARLRSMSKVLDLSTPSADEGESASNNASADDEVAARRRRRRALAVLLRTMANESSNSKMKGTTIIRRIQKMAQLDAKQATLLDDMSNRLPSGLETPKYDVVTRRKAGYEIRNYEPYSVCTVEMKSSMKANDEARKTTDAKVSMPQLSGASSFGALAGYLFGKNSQETAMKMTTPVLTTNAGMDVADATSVGETKEMSFVLPSTYWNEDGTEKAPQPLDGSGVRLRRDEGGTRATLMFGGFANKAEVQERKKQLISLLEGDTEYVMVDGAKTTLSQYNDVSCCFNFCLPFAFRIYSSHNPFFSPLLPHGKD
jgi:hypothetical protein